LALKLAVHYNFASSCCSFIFLRGLLLGQKPPQQNIHKQLQAKVAVPIKAKKVHTCD
jgi:hypothetical protein